MTPMFSIFTLAIKFDCLFLAIFQSFHLFVSCIFDKLAPSLNLCLKNVLNPYLVHSSAYSSLKMAKSVFFSYSAFWSTYQWVGLYPPRPPWLRYCK